MDPGRVSRNRFIPFNCSVYHNSKSNQPRNGKMKIRDVFASDFFTTSFTCLDISPLTSRGGGVLGARCVCSISIDNPMFSSISGSLYLVFD